MDVSMRNLLSAGAHFGHQSRYWNPKMKRHISATYNHIHIINLEHTIAGLRRASEFVHNIAKNRNKLLLVGTKRAAQEIIKEQALSINQFYVDHRWMGGTLTNYKTVYSSIEKFRELTKESEDGSWHKMKKKEALTRQRLLVKLEKSIGGIKDMNGLPDALFVIDIRYEHIAVLEAKKLGIPVIAVVDTNSDPDNADHIIPGNDDSIRAIKLYVSTIVDAFNEGMKLADELSMMRKTKTEISKPAEKKSLRIEGTLGRGSNRTQDSEGKEEKTMGKEMKTGKKSKAEAENSRGKEHSPAVGADAVRELRIKTGAGIMECKRALQEAKGDADQAVDFLRKSGRIKALKKSTRETKEGFLVAKLSGNLASLAEINCETDFVARNEELLDFGERLISECHERKARLPDEILKEGNELEVRFQEIIGKLNENIQIAPFIHLEGPQGGKVTAYIHTNKKIASLVAIDKDDEELCHDLALQIAAMEPLAATVEKIPPDILEKEREIYRAQVKDSGKSPEVQEKMVEGMMKKFAATAALSEQIFIKDATVSIGSMLKKADVKEVRFIRRELGQETVLGY